MLLLCNGQHYILFKKSSASFRLLKITTCFSVLYFSTNSYNLGKQLSAKSLISPSNSGSNSFCFIHQLQPIVCLVGLFQCNFQLCNKILLTISKDKSSSLFSDIKDLLSQTLYNKTLIFSIIYRCCNMIYEKPYDILAAQA